MSETNGSSCASRRLGPGWRLTSALLASGFVACNITPMVLYDGPPRPDTEVAIISTFSSSGTVLTIDGRPMPSSEFLFALEPGTHHVVYRVDHSVIDATDVPDNTPIESRTTQYRARCTFTAEMEAGHRYIVGGSVGLGSQIRGSVRDEQGRRDLPVTCAPM